MALPRAQQIYLSPQKKTNKKKTKANKQTKKLTKKLVYTVDVKGSDCPLKGQMYSQ